MNSFYIYKSIGDIIYSIPAIQEYGGGSIYTGLPIEQHNALKPLIEGQYGISGFFHESEHGLPKGFINLENFRYIQDNPMHICDSFSLILGCSPSYRRHGWLEVTDSSTVGQSYSVLNVTSRYRDKVFNWYDEIELLLSTESGIVFIGHLDEYKAFTKRYGKHRIRYLKTYNFLEVAKIIQGAEYFSGTQSACLAIAQGLGRTYRYERSPFFDNVMTGDSRETILNNNCTRKIHFALSRIQEAYRNFRK